MSAGLTWVVNVAVLLVRSGSEVVDDTVTELIIALCGIATLTAASWGIYALVHFIRKAW